MAGSGTGRAKIFGEENFSETQERAHRIELGSLFQMLLSIVENELTVDVFRRAGCATHVHTCIVCLVLSLAYLLTYLLRILGGVLSK